MSYIIRAASLKDAAKIAPLLRDADKNEIAAISGLSPLDALEYSISHSDEAFYVTRPDGYPLAVFGVATDQDVGIPWMLGTDELKRYGVSLVKAGRKWVEKWVREYDLLYNYVDARNTTHINWLTKLGFDVILKDEYIGHDKSVPFLPFYRSNSCASH